MRSRMESSIRASVVAIAPLVLLAGLSYHPYLPGLQPNLEALAAAVASDPMRWGVAHLATGIASAIVILAFLAIRSRLREAGEDHWSAAALPFVVIGSTLYAMLPAMEFAPLAAIEAGGDSQAAQAAQAALAPWFIPVLVAGGISFAAGMLGFALAILRSGILSPGLTWVVAAGLVIAALARFVPLFAIQFYVQSLALCLALLPVAYRMWRRPVEQGADVAVGVAR